MPIESPAPAGRPAPAAAPRARAGATKVGRRLRPAGGQPAHRHEAAHLEAGQGQQRRPGRVASVGSREAGLGRVGVDVDLQVDRQPTAGPAPCSATRRSRRCGEVDRIDRLDDVEQLQARAALLRWRWPTRCHSHGPRSGHLGRRLLDPVLAQSIVAGSRGQAQPLDRHGLGDGDQADRRLAARPARAAGGGDALEHLQPCRAQRGDGGPVGPLVERAAVSVRGRRSAVAAQEGRDVEVLRLPRGRRQGPRAAPVETGTATASPGGLALRRPRARHGRRPRCAGAAAPACSRGSPGRPGRRLLRPACSPCRTATTCGRHRSRWR